MTSAPSQLADPSADDRHHPPAPHAAVHPPTRVLSHRNTVPAEGTGLRLVPPDAIPTGVEVLAVLVRDPVPPAAPLSALDPGDRALHSPDTGLDRPHPCLHLAAAAQPFGSVLAGPGLVIHEQARLVYLDGHEVGLTRREFDLLLHFTRYPGRVHSRARLLATAWGFDDPPLRSSRNVDVHVARLRRKLGPLHGGRLETLRGVGYRWSPRYPTLTTASGPQE